MTAVNNLHVALSCPYPMDSPHGNSVTARRIVSIFEEMGIAIEAEYNGFSKHANVLIALHAVRSREVILAYRKQNPTGKIIVLLTGTDIYRDLLDAESPGYESLDIADVIVVTLEPSLQGLAPQYREKAVVIPKSLDLPKLPELSEVKKCSSPTMSIVTHLRATKNPFFAIEALQLEPQLNWSIHQLGGVREEGMEQQAKDWQRKDSRFHWLGLLERRESLLEVAQSHVFVNSSKVDAAANAVLEAMALGMPVLATNIEGNTGLLGEHYAGYFDVNDKEGFLELLKRCQKDRVFRESLVIESKRRAALFSRENEVNNWKNLLDSLK